MPASQTCSRLPSPAPLIFLLLAIAAAPPSASVSVPAQLSQPTALVVQSLKNGSIGFASAVEAGRAEAGGSPANDTLVRVQLPGIALSHRRALRQDNSASSKIDVVAVALVVLVIVALAGAFCDCCQSVSWKESGQGVEIEFLIEKVALRPSAESSS